MTSIRTQKQLSHRTQHNGGFALLLALIISSVVLAIGLTLLAVAIKQLALSSTSRESEIAFQMATLGMECGRYWRDELADELFDTGSGSGTFSGVRCMNVLPNTRTFQALNNSDPRDPGSSGQQNILSLEFDISVGGEDRCINVDINVIEASSDINDHLVGRVETSCADGDRCTVVISQGYNRSCSQVTNSIYSVQRELTAEF